MKNPIDFLIMFTLLIIVFMQILRALDADKQYRDLLDELRRDRRRNR